MNEINRKLIDRLCFWALVGLLMMVMAALFSSCRTQYIPVETIRTEIRYEKSKDSTRIVDKVNVRDSVRMRDSIVQIVNDKGEVIRTEVWRWKEKYSDVNTLYSSLKSKYDSLYSAKSDSVQVPYPVERKLTKWQTMKLELGEWMLGIIVAMILLIIGWILYRWKTFYRKGGEHVELR